MSGPGMLPLYVQACTFLPGSTSTSATRAVRFTSTILGSGLVSGASASLISASHPGGASEGAADVGGPAGVGACAAAPAQMAHAADNDNSKIFIICILNTYYTIHVTLTKFSDYSLRLLLYLALHPDRLVSVSEVSRAYGISPHIIVKAVQLLVREGLVVSVRGRNGG